MNGVKRGSVPLVPIRRIFFRAIAWWPMTDRRPACAGGQRPIFRPVLDPRPPHGYRRACPKARLDGFVRASSRFWGRQSWTLPVLLRLRAGFRRGLCCLEAIAFQTARNAGNACG